MRALTVFFITFVAFACISCQEPEAPLESRQATGVKIGEVDSTSAVIWTRVTESDQRRADGEVRRGRPDRKAPREHLDPRDLEGSTPGAPGRVQIRYGLTPDLGDAAETEWRAVAAEDDYTHQFHLTDLEPGATYYFESRTSDPTGHVLHLPLSGSFQTAPAADVRDGVRGVVITGQAYRDTDDPDGFSIYRSMLEFAPHWIVPTGDTVYYDSDDPLAVSLEIARYHWTRMYSYPTLVDFHRQVSGYWEKDDHDSYANDGWPGLHRDYMGDFSYELGLKVFAEQVPFRGEPYRRFRWGKGLEIWLVEGRDFRSPNDAEDGPEKTIWGAEQKKWLTESLLASDADWKLLISPTPIVGPDRGKKADNHANEAFAHEGDWFRAWAAENLGDQFFIACGDRHWQYHSVDPKTGVQEFSSGPVSDEHASGTPGEDPEMHRYHNVQGGFLSVETDTADGESRITFRFHGVDGEADYKWSHTRPL